MEVTRHFDQCQEKGNSRSTSIEFITSLLRMELHYDQFLPRVSDIEGLCQAPVVQTRTETQPKLVDKRPYIMVFAPASTVASLSASSEARAMAIKTVDTYSVKQDPSD